MIEVKVYNIKVEDINKSDSNTKDTYPMVEYQFYGFLMDEIQLVNEQNARLKGEVERLATIIGADAIDREHGMCCDASAQVERLTKAVMHSPAAQLKLKELEGKTTYEEINPKESNQSK